MEKPTSVSNYKTADSNLPIRVNWLSRSKDTWCVHPNLGDRRGSLECPASGSSSLPPEKEWTYYNGQKHLTDPLLSCLPLSFSSPCTIITVTAMGEAERLHPDCLGTYRSDGQYSSCRQVISLLSTHRPSCHLCPRSSAGREEGRRDCSWWGRGRLDGASGAQRRLQGHGSLPSQLPLSGHWEGRTLGQAWTERLAVC